MNHLTENQLAEALGRLQDDIDRALVHHDAFGQTFIDAKAALDSSAQHLHELQRAHYEIEFMLDHKRVPVLADVFATNQGSEVRQRITDALLLPALLKTVADANAEARREAAPFKSQTPPVYAETPDGHRFELGEGEELAVLEQIGEEPQQSIVDVQGMADTLANDRENSPADPEEVDDRTEDEKLTDELHRLIGRVAERWPRNQIMATTRRAYDAAKESF